MEHPRAAFGLLLGLLLWSGQAGAVRLEQVGDQPEPGDPGAGDYLVGAMVTSSGTHVGEPSRGASLRPLWSLQWGKLRITTTRASALWRLGRDGVDPGVSAVLLDRDRLRLSASLQLDDGRRSGDDAYLSGLPDVRRTLRGRVTARYTLGPRWSTAVSLSHDLRHRDGSTTLAPSLKYRLPTEADTLWELSLGATLGNARYQRTFYGIDAAAVQQSGRAAYVPGGGWAQWQLGMDVSHAIDRHWVVFGSVGWSQLVGGARRSPLVSNTGDWSASLGLGYRCC